MPAGSRDCSFAARFVLRCSFCWTGDSVVVDGTAVDEALVAFVDAFVFVEVFVDVFVDAFLDDTPVVFVVTRPLPFVVAVLFVVAPLLGAVPLLGALACTFAPPCGFIAP